MGQPESRQVQEHQSDQRVEGDCSEYPMHGVWKHGKHFRDWCAFHQEPEHRRKKVVWGVPHQCSGILSALLHLAYLKNTQLV